MEVYQTDHNNSLFMDSYNNEEEYGKNYWVLILLVLCVFVVFGNVLVIMSVARERLLQNMTNFFIVSLALADLLVAGFVMPFSVYVLVNWGMWGLPKKVCDFYIASDVVCSTSSIFNLVAVSIDRYYAVTAPITYSQHKDKHGRVYVFIFLCWLASIAIGSPIMLGANHIPEDEEHNSSSSVNWNSTDGNISYSKNDEFVCAFYNPDFIIYSSLGSFYIPCFVMIFLYGRIFKTLHQRAVKAKKSKQKAPIPTKPQIKEPIPNAQGAKLSLTVTSNGGGGTRSCLADIKFNFNSDRNSKGTQESKKEINVEISQQDNGGNSCPSSCSPSQQQSLVESSENTINSIPPKPNMAHKACGPDTSLYERSKASGRNGKDKINGPDSTPMVQRGPTKDQNDAHLKSPGGIKLSTEAKKSCHLDITSFNQTEVSEDLTKKKNLREYAGNLFKMKQGSLRKFGDSKKKKKEKNAARKERKATKTLAIVLGCFLVCWTPFFTCNMINAICIKLESSWHPGDTAFLITTWLGYVNSCINPIIYTIFNPEFRKAFKKLLGMETRARF